MPTAFDAVIVKVKSPSTDGVPESVPPGESDMPAGNAPVSE